jgi:hypothetical protein
MTPDENPLVDRSERLVTLISRLGVQLDALDAAVSAMNGTTIYRDNWEPTPYALRETRRWCEGVRMTGERLIVALDELERATATVVVHGRSV